MNIKRGWVKVITSDLNSDVRFLAIVLPIVLVALYLLRGEGDLQGE